MVATAERKRRGATLVLSNGMRLRGYSFGAAKSVSGEAVFQTGMVGYPESLTDPSYKGQLLTLTFPLIGNYGAPKMEESDEFGVPRFVESDRIHAAALIVAEYSGDEQFSHWNAAGSLGAWMRSFDVPGIAGIDTRLLTKTIRESGTMLAKIVVDDDPSVPDEASLPFDDPNTRNLVREVSIAQKRVFNPQGAPHIVVVDVGLKNNQLRCLLKRGCKVTMVPFDYDFTSPAAHEEDGEFDGIFVSNGPGDPMMADVTIAHLRKAIAFDAKSEGSGAVPKPVFGICLGHQLLALAAGFSTHKLKYGNRGHNQPCIEHSSGRCYITSQNHGYVVDVAAGAVPDGWGPTFTNANDQTNEGISCARAPFFSVQFHPEANAGPNDTEHLFDCFLNAVRARLAGKGLSEVTACIPPPLPEPRLERQFEVTATVKKVLVLGSGGLSIGQAGEFDYSGSQCIKALKQEGIQTVLLNPNIATVQTSRGMADKVYFLPVNPENVIKVIHNEKPDSILLTFGGQTALNCGVQLYKRGVFDALGVRILGTPIEAILDTEDRERFNARLLEIGEPFADSVACRTMDEVAAAANKLGYPLILRAAFALGGLGSGFANNDEELTTLAHKAFSASSQVLVERSMRGWKEIEYEVVRDAYNNCITVCNMENFDPLGVHTGDSIVVAPSQTLTNDEYNMLRDAALRTIRHLGVVGECNIQYALNPTSRQYCIIEVNARLSRSSALASKATGYPLAFVAAKLALGKRLTDVRNSITEETCACFEPSLDYLVVKIPRWDLKKFERVDPHLGSAMKSVGEVMGIGRNFEEAIQKAIRMVRDNYVSGFESGRTPYDPDEMRFPTDNRLLSIATGFAEGRTVDEIHALSSIDRWFLMKLHNISVMEKRLRELATGGSGGVSGNSTAQPSPMSPELLLEAKSLGFSDKQIGGLVDDIELGIRNLRYEYGIVPVVKRIDTVAAEFPAKTNYLYTSYSCTNLDARPNSDAAYDVTFTDKGIMVLGNGAYRIGSSVEFDWCAVSASRTLRSQGFHSIMVNYNPETVSTDYDECDRLYFEELSFERVLDIYKLEGSSGVIVSMGGQIPNNIAMPLHRAGVNILGTTPDMIDSAENRYKFSRMLDRIGVDQPEWKELSSVADAMAFCTKVGYPVLVRPSYVLSGAAMNVAYKEDDLEAYLTEAATVSLDCPVVISKFIQEAKEIEVDAVALKGQLVMHVVSEHVENAGVHSGDATLVLPPVDLDPVTVRKVEAAAAKVADALNVTGPMNIQFMAKDNEIKVIECNLRAARSFPFVSKTVGIDLAKMATKVMLGRKVTPYPVDVSALPYVGVKVAQFSFTRLLGADPILGVEMASTGEVACYGANAQEAYIKALNAATVSTPRKSIGLSIGIYKEKLEFLPSAKKLVGMGYTLYATPGTAEFLSEHQIPATVVVWPNAGEYLKESELNIIDLLRQKKIELFINIPSMNKYRRQASFASPGYLSRRAAVDFGVPLLTNIKCAKMLVKSLGALQAYPGGSIPVSVLDSRFSSRVISFPGLISLHSFLSKNNRNWAAATDSALRGGFTFVAAADVDADLHAAQKAAHVGAKCDYVLLAVATPDNVATILPAAKTCATLLIDPARVEKEHDSDAADKSGRDGGNGSGGGSKTTGSINPWLAHLESWPSSLPIFVNASGTILGGILFGSVVHGRAVHVRDVRRREDLELIRLAKQHNLRVTCDADVLTLCPQRGDSCGDADAAVAHANREALFEHLEMIDVVTGPHDVVLPLLLAMHHEGRISLEYIEQRLYSNPRAILGVPEQESTYIEIDLDVSWTGAPSSQLDGVPCRGLVRRVVLRGELALLDGKVLASAGTGHDLSAAVADDAALAASSKTSAPPTPALAPLMNQAYDMDDIALGSGSGGSGGTVAVVAAAKAQAPTLASAQTVGYATKRNMAPSRMWSASRGGAGGEDANGGALVLERSSSAVAKGVLAAPSLQNHATVAPGRIPGPLPGYGTGWWAGRHILSVDQFSRDDLHHLFGVAAEMRQICSRVGYYELLKGKILGCMFLEPSTRTSSSFQCAMQRLGGTVVQLSDVNMSSMAKGESLGDTVRTMNCYSDLLVVRHPEQGKVRECAISSRKPVLSAGDGIGEHPTQALLDVFTIREELGTVNGLTITFVGDLKNGRTVHSLAKLLSLYQVKLRYVSPESLRMPADVVADCASRGLDQREHTSLTEALLRETDVLYVTRVQKERFPSVEEYELVKGAFVINAKTLTRAKSSMIVMHPLPRVNEIHTDVDSDPRAVYFLQMEYGVYVRMALLALVLGKA
ncbi:CAD protein [Porphyridium purpureum]|uniref:CAD protein n=1 Tax=Porphyridium purpureum TaxID=35688 RepID=A0A5J4YVR9_PORPP|nr:CAD protein [Porphyridium purpureum]|eukprot:POR6982..scf209_3